MLEQLTEESWYSPFPQYQVTERPDRAALELLNGKVVLLCDNSPSALILPGSFSGFMESSEDWYHHFEMASFFEDSALSGTSDGNASAGTLSGGDPFSYTDSSSESASFLCRGKRGSTIYKRDGADFIGTGI